MRLYPDAKQANRTSEHLNDSRFTYYTHACQMWVLQDLLKIPACKGVPQNPEGKCSSSAIQVKAHV